MSNCTSCNADLAPGTRWCDICHTNTVDSSLGTLASPLKRAVAFTLEGILPGLVLLSMILASGASRSLADTPEEGAALGGTLLIVLLLGYVGWALLMFTRGTTPAKRLLGMWVIKENGKKAGFLTMLIRETIGKWISGLVFLLGYLWILWDKGNQAWHDKFVSTFVVTYPKA